MRRLSITLIAILLVFIAIPKDQTAASQGGQPVVRVVLFWMNGCPSCTQTLTGILPELQEKYQSQLRIRLIELVSASDVDNLYAIGNTLGLSRDQVGVPFLIIDHIVLIGADDIETKLPGLITESLAKGGTEVPEMPILSEMLAKGIDFASSNLYQSSALQTTSEENPLGIAVAWGVLVLMGLAVIFALVMIARAIQGKTLTSLKGGGDIIILVLSLIGLGVAIYLTYVEVTGARAICGPVGDCNAVQHSPYANLFGFIPIAWLGVAGYLAILVVWLWQHMWRNVSTNLAGAVIYGMALFGTLLSIYLTYLEIFVIYAICVWCLSSAVLITALMLLNLPSVTQWLAIPEEE
jgi:uncharacterized membrane protein